jgi:putative membrane fusion protein
MTNPPRRYRRRTERDEKKRQTIKNLRKKIFIAAILVICVLIIYQPIKNLAISRMLRFETAQWKVLEQSIPGEGVVIREETLIFAPAGGTFEPLMAEGEKAAAGDIIGYIKTQGITEQADSVKIPLKAPKAGLVSYHPDGLEEVLKPDLMDHLDLDKVAALLKEKKRTKSNSTQVESGKPICKMVDNLVNPFLYLQGPAENFGSLERGQALTVRFSEEKTAKITLRDVKSQQDQIFFMAEVLDAPDLDLKNRFIPVELILDRFEGVAVLKEALVEMDGEKGVFVSKKGIYKWIKLDVKGYAGQEAVVSGLEAGSEYIVNPHLARQNQRIY